MSKGSIPTRWVRAVTDEEERLTGRIIGSAMEVHRQLGPGFLESIYHEALEHQLSIDGLRFQSEVEVKVAFKGIEVGRQRFDLLVEGQVILSGHT